MEKNEDFGMYKTKKSSQFFKKNQVVSDIISMERAVALAHQTQLINVDTKGFYFDVKKDQILVPEQVFLKKLLNHYVQLFISKYELKVQGVIKNISFKNRNLFRVHIGFTDTTPAFYKECISDLMS